jgi:alkylation response protein AidB-like acyl-CoA dehydrogenase
MELTYPTEDEQFRAEIRAWLTDNLPKGWFDKNFEMSNDERKKFNDEWPSKLFAGGWICATWPKEYGGKGLSTMQGVVLSEEFANAKAPMRADFFGDTLVGPTLLQWGTEEQKKEFLPQILNGSMRWCQGFSEPNSGSDLASLKTSAVLDGDEWVVNGQKVWTSGAMNSEMGVLLARTGEEPRNRGISMLLIPMNQPGVEVRPLRQMTGAAEFNEVFFTNARVPRDWVVGEVNDGWRAATGLLAHERSSLGNVGADTKREASGHAAVPFHYLQALAERTGYNTDPLMRQDLARAYTGEKLMGWVAQRKVFPSVRKLWRTKQSRFVSETASRMTLNSALAQEVDDKDGDFWRYFILNAPRMSIGGGTDEIQKNTIGERALGLPREPS